MSMNKMAFALAMALGLVAAQKASAVTEYYSIKGSNCTSITSGIIGQYGQYGISPNGATGMNVTCPIVLQDRAYTQYTISVWGYSRSNTEKVNCTISSTDYGGSGAASATAAVTANQPASQNATATLYPNATGAENAMLLCHIPGTTADGPSYLTWIRLTAVY
jgi:hypothetical protein